MDIWESLRNMWVLAGQPIVAIIVLLTAWKILRNQMHFSRLLMYYGKQIEEIRKAGGPGGGNGTQSRSGVGLYEVLMEPADQARKQQQQQQQPRRQRPG